MSRQSRTKLVLPKTEPSKQALEPIEESGVPEQKEESALPELDMEIECARCSDIMELFGEFDHLSYYCGSCKLEMSIN